jgi:hypothetical protein
VATVAVGVLVAAGTFVVAPAYAEPSPADRTFKSLDEAAEGGAIDASTVATLRRNRRVQALAILDGDSVAAAYGTGDKKGVAAAAGALREIRDAVLARTDVTATQST